MFRQCGGARCAHNLVPYEFSRRQALSLVKQLLLSTGGDDDLGTLLCLMQKEPPENTQLKISVLKVSRRGDGCRREVGCSRGWDGRRHERSS